MNDEDTKEVETTPCPVCDGDSVPLGQLGLIAWFRCRQCGWEHNVEVAK